MNRFAAAPVAWAGAAVVEMFVDRLLAV